jgi:ribulose-5-phosphate 4-epimerase/fuculose-1-phosphate aldolase
MDEKTQLRARIARACRILGALALTGPTTGHVSARVPGTNAILIRARGPGELGVRYTTAEEIVEVGMDGELTQPNDRGLKSPIEVFIHTEVYRARPDVHSVIHIHPRTVVLFTVCDTPLLPLYGAYNPAAALLALDGIPTYERSILISTPSLGAELAHTLGAARVCMMRGHGITTTGWNIEEAALAAIDLNELATFNRQAYALGKPRPISNEDQAEFKDRTPLTDPPIPPGAEPSGRAASLWRYYCRLLEDE